MKASLSKCLCNHCSAHVEFEPEHVGEAVICPHCGLETILYRPPPSSGDRPTGSDEPHEEIFFSGRGVSVTKTRFCVPGETYALASISSVQMTVKEASRAFPGLLLVVSILLLFLSFAESKFDASAFTFGLIMLIFSVIWLWKQKNVYQVTLGFSGAERTGYRSEDRNLISNLVEALNRAIIARG